MPASDATVIGFAKQVSKGTAITADASFTYLLFKEGGLPIQNTFLPLDAEVGGGAMLRDVIKAGVFSGGRLAFIPRPKSLGLAFMGILGRCVSTDLVGGAYSHAFTLPTDQFDAPWYTGRSAPGFLWGEQLPDMRFSGLTLGWKGGRFVEGELNLLGAGVPSKVATTTWAPATYVDGGPQFIAPLGVAQLPTGTAVKVLSGAFMAASSIPLDEQMIVGSYSPDSLDIVQKAFVISMLIKISDGTLANKMQLDPAGGAAWVASVYKEAGFTLSFASPSLAKVGVPYSFTIGGNAQTGTDANVAWSVAPISVKAGKQVTMAVTGTFLADPDGSHAPITLTLVNQQASY